MLPTLLHIPAQIDFGAYYVAARILNAAAPLYRPEAVDAHALGIADIPHTGYIYPPFFAGLLRPLAMLPYRTAETVWFAFNLVLFAIMLVLLAQLGQLQRRWFGPLLLGALLLPATYDTWLLGQVSILLTVLLAGSILAATHPHRQPWHDVAAGVLFALATIIKVYPVILGLIYLVHRRFTTLLAAGITGLVAMLVGMLLGGGWRTTQHWLTTMLPATSTMPPFPSNQSFRGVIARFFAPHEFRVPVLTRENYLTVTLQPIIDHRQLGNILVMFISLFLLTVTGWAVAQRHRGSADARLRIDFALGITVILLVTPVVWDLYYVHLLIPLLVVLREHRAAIRYHVWLALACLLLALQRYWRYILLYAQTRWLMLFGCLSVCLVWAILLHFRTQGLPVNRELT